jgi:hypothetical protein
LVSLYAVPLLLLVPPILGFEAHGFYSVLMSGFG